MRQHKASQLCEEVIGQNICRGDHRKPARPLAQTNSLLNEQMISVKLVRRRLVPSSEIISLSVVPMLIFQQDVRWITDYRIKAAPLHDCREFGFPIEDINPKVILIPEEASLLALIIFRTDERVTALDVSSKIGQRAHVK